MDLEQVATCMAISKAMSQGPLNPRSLPQWEHQPLAWTRKNQSVNQTHFWSYQVSLVKGLLPIVQLLLQVALLPAEQVLEDREGPLGRDSEVENR